MLPAFFRVTYSLHIRLRTSRESFFFLSTSSAAAGGARPSWNSNGNLVVSNPVLALMESCDSMAQMLQIQAQMTCSGLVSQRFPASRIVAFCALSDPGDMRHAGLVFSRTPEPNTYMWNTMIRGYSMSKDPFLAIFVFKTMARDRVVEMDGRTFVFVIKACEQLVGAASAGEGAHSLIQKMGFSSHLLVQNGLLHFYSEMGWIEDARKIFDRIPDRDVVSWTTIVDAYNQSHLPKEALLVTIRMISGGTRPNEVTMIEVLSACSEISALSFGESVHAVITKRGMTSFTRVMNALVDMYGKCDCVDSARALFDEIEMKCVISWTSLLTGYVRSGHIEAAMHVFDEMPVKNAVSWSSMIAGYSKSDQPIEAINLFQEMITLKVEPLDATLVSVFSACARTGCLDLGQWIFDYYVCGGRIGLSVTLGNASIDMFSKCGAIDTAAKLFNLMPEKDIVSWNSMIVGYAIHGCCNEALLLLERMKTAGVKPDDITFVGVLCACSRSGFVTEGHKHFEDMSRVFGITPNLVHYACKIDLLCRVGHLEDALELLAEMPVEPNEAGWGALLNACRLHGNVELGECAGEKLLGIDPGDSGTYTILSNMYAKTKQWDDVKKLRRMIREQRIKKTAGCSSIEVDGAFHEFFVGDGSHSLSEEIYGILDVLYKQLKRQGCVSTYV